MISFNFKIIAVGKIKDLNLNNKIEEYLKRLSHDTKTDIIEIKDSNPLSEGLKIQEILKKENSFSIALTEEGKTYGSIDFSRYLAAIPGKITFVIGGPFGLSEQVKNTCRQRLSLSPMTFTNEMARLLLLEQLYRAVSIQNNRSYHKE